MKRRRSDKTKCVFMVCECRLDRENRELIHRRDRAAAWWETPGLRRSLEQRMEEELCQLQLDFARGDISSTEDFEERVEFETNYWTHLIEGL